MVTATVALYKFGHQDFGCVAPQAEYAGTITVSGPDKKEEITYEVIVRIKGKRLKTVNPLPTVLDIAVEEV